MKKIIIYLLLFYSQDILAQSPVIDRANSGQMKRMVFDQWDDWQPTPETGLFGIPKNLSGWLYWRVLHKKYFKGEDSRPYKITGPFAQNYASLALQEKDDIIIRDSIQKVMETNAATYISMSGGSADVAWTIYFGKQFDKLTNEVLVRLISLSEKHPVAAAKMISNKYYSEYLEYLDIVKDRIQIIHNSLVDKGERIISYLEIQKEIQHRNNIMNHMINSYIQLTKLPNVDQVKESQTKNSIQTNDAEIIKKILINFNF